MNDVIVCPHCNFEFDPRGVLTYRELQIALLMCQEFKNKDIVKNLYIAISTVKKHISNIFRKLKIDNRIALYKYMVANESLDKEV